MPNDQDSLITSESVEVSQKPKTPLFLFVGLQIFQFFLCILTISTTRYFFFLIIQILFSIVNFITCKDYFGKNLVGLSWKFNFKNPSEYFYDYEIEPDPFVPEKINSNVFWIVMAGSTFFWILASIFVRIIGGWSFFFGYLIVCALSFVNFFIFFKIEKIAHKMSAGAVRTALLGQSEFPNAEEFSDDDDDDDEEKKTVPTNSETPKKSDEKNSVDNVDENKDKNEDDNEK